MRTIILMSSDSIIQRSVNGFIIKASTLPASRCKAKPRATLNLKMPISIALNAIGAAVTVPVKAATMFCR